MTTNILTQLINGADFAQLAQLSSDDLASGAQGGDLGYVRRGEFVPSFEQVAFTLEPGQISDIVETSYGYHVIQLLDKQGEKIHARHILVTSKPTEADREAALEKVRHYFYDLSDHPSRFDSLMQFIAQDNPSPDHGYIGWVDFGTLPSESYRLALFGASLGDITPPFETEQGFHILNVMDLKEGGIPTLKEYYPQIESMALAEKQVAYFGKWIERARKEIFIKVLD